MRDYDVRSALRALLLEEQAEQLDRTLVVDELGLCGQARVDVAVVNGALTGYELKSARDRLDRLPNQVDVYGRVLDYAYLVVADVHLAHARKCSHTGGVFWLPKKLSARSLSNISEKRARTGESKQLRLRSYCGAMKHWRFLPIMGMIKECEQRPEKLTRETIWDRLSRTIGLDQLRCEVREILRARRG